MNTDEHGMFSSAVPFWVPFWPQAPGIFLCQCTRLCPGWGAVRRFDSDGNEEHLHSLGFQKCELRWNNSVLRLQRIHVLVNLSVFFFMVARSPLVALQSAKAGRIKEQERTCFRKSTTADRRQSALSGSAIKRWATELQFPGPESCGYVVSTLLHCSRLQEWLHVDLGPRWTWWGHGSGLFRSSQVVRCLGWGSPAFGGGRA